MILTCCHPSGPPAWHPAPLSTPSSTDLSTWILSALQGFKPLLHIEVCLPLDPLRNGTFPWDGPGQQASLPPPLSYLCLSKRPSCQRALTPYISLARPCTLPAPLASEQRTHTSIRSVRLNPYSYLLPSKMFL